MCVEIHLPDGRTIVARNENRRARFDNECHRDGDRCLCGLDFAGILRLIAENYQFVDNVSLLAITVANNGMDIRVYESICKEQKEDRVPSQANPPLPVKEIETVKLVAHLQYGYVTLSVDEQAIARMDMEGATALMGELVEILDEEQWYQDIHADIETWIKHKEGG